MRLVLLLWIIPCIGIAQLAIPDGTNKVNIPGQAESYLEFVPENYDENRLWPVVFVFDPGGNAANGIRPFLSSANEFGYLIFASDDAQNGRHTENFDIAGRMMNQAIANYSIDAKRMYVAGFSGGSRLASAIAVLSKQMAGVIACGSGFSPNVNEQPTNEKFRFAGLVGTADMNYAEMHAAHAWLDKFQVPNRLFVFEGEHRWPDPATIRRAFIWLEQGSVSQSSEELLLADRAYGDSLYTAGNFLMAHKEFTALRDGNPPPNQRSYAMDMLNRINQQQGVSQMLREESALLAQENKTLNELSEHYLEDLKNPKKSSLKWWEKQIAKINQAQDASTAVGQQSARLIRHIRAIALESGFVDQNHKNSYKKALFSSRLLILTDPQSGYYHYLEIYTHESGGQRTLALEALEDAFKMGWLNPSEFTTYKLHQQLKDDRSYQELISRYSSD